MAMEVTRDASWLRVWMFRSAARPDQTLFVFFEGVVSFVPLEREPFTAFKGRDFQARGIRLSARYIGVCEMCERPFSVDSFTFNLLQPTSTACSSTCNLPLAALVPLQSFSLRFSGIRNVC